MFENKFPCLISEERTCFPTPIDNLVFIIGPGSSEFEKDLERVIDVLKGFGLEGYFALLSEKEKGLDVFCDKICSKILRSLFCIAILNNPITLHYIDKETKKKQLFRAPRVNVYFEYGIATAMRKNIIPIMVKHTTLPFDVQHLDVVTYGDFEELRKKLIISIREILSKESRESIVKMPKLGLLLIDEEGKATDKMKVNPIITKIKYIERKEPLTQSQKRIEMMVREYNRIGLSLIYTPFVEKEPEKDLIPIGICIWNEGELPADSIGVFIKFPKECEIINKHDAVGGLSLPLTSREPTRGGLYVDHEDNTTAIAWMNRLGNDREVRNFNKIYVRFPTETEEEKEYTIYVNVLQDSYKPTRFEFKIIVKPQIKEITRYKSEKG